MGSRSRIRTTFAQSGGGGGAPPTIGNVEWGSDFGEANGSDGNTFIASVSTKLTALNLAANLNTSVSTKLSSVTLGAFPTVTTGVTLAGTALGAPYWQSENNVGNSALGGGIIPVTKPSGTVAGDLLVAFVAVSGTAASVSGSPSGWTLQASNTTSSSPSIYCYTKVAGGSEPASYSWNSTATGTVNNVAGIHRVNGVHASTPVNVTATSSGSATNPVAPSATTTTTNCLVLHGVAQTSTTTAYSFTPPSGYAERWDTSGGSALPVSMTSATRVRPTAAATGTQTYTSSASLASQYACITIAIAPGVVTL